MHFILLDFIALIFSKQYKLHYAHYAVFSVLLLISIFLPPWTCSSVSQQSPCNSELQIHGDLAPKQGPL